MTEQVNSLAVLDQAQKMLAAIRTTDDAKHLMSLAEAARHYAKRIGAGLEVQNDAAEIKIRAQRAAGGILEQMTKAKAGRPPENRVDDQPDFRGAPTYEQLGIKKYDAHIWRNLWAIPEEEFEDCIATTRYEGFELSTDGVYKEAHKPKKKKKPKLSSNPTIEKFNEVQLRYGDALNELVAGLRNNPPDPRYIYAVIRQIEKTQATESVIIDSLRAIG